MINTITFFSLSDTDALGAIRFLGPMRQLGLHTIKGVENGAIRIDAVNDGDIIVIQRDFPRNLDAYEKILALSHTQGKPVILDLDDLLFELPENHPDRESSYYSEALLPMLQAVMEVDLITVATQPLKNYLEPYNKHIRVVPNYLDDTIWKFTDPQSNLREGKINIGYMGGHTHRPDLMMIVPALERLLQKYPGEISFKFWGIEPPAELLPFSKVDWAPPLTTRYDDFVNYFQAQTSDIVVAPLTDNLFNECKSHIKFMEYSANGMPGVYSQIFPYNQIITNGVEGFLASNVEEWEMYLSNLIEKPSLRLQIAKDAQNKVKDGCLLSQNASAYIEAYLSAKVEKEHAFPGIYKICKEFSKQYFVELQKRKQIISNLNEKTLKNDKDVILYTDQLRESKKKISSLNDQIIKRDKQILYLTEKYLKLEKAIINPSRQLEEKDKRISFLTKQLNKEEEKLISLINQISEKETQISELTQQLNHATNKELLHLKEIKDLEEEILSYVTSYSWRMTRPLRKLFHIFNRGKL